MFYGYQRFLPITAVGAPTTPSPTTTLQDASTVGGTVNAAWNPLPYYLAVGNKRSKTSPLTFFGEASLSYTGGGAFVPPGMTAGIPGDTTALVVGGGAAVNFRLDAGRVILTPMVYGGARIQWDTVGSTTFPAAGGYAGGAFGVSWR